MSCLCNSNMKFLHVVYFDLLLTIFSQYVIKAQSLPYSTGFCPQEDTPNCDDALAIVACHALKIATPSESSLPQSCNLTRHNPVRNFYNIFTLGNDDDYVIAQKTGTVQYQGRTVVSPNVGMARCLMHKH